MNNKFLDLLKSRKFWAAVIGLCAVFLGNRAGLDQKQVVDAVIVLTGYILGTALEARYSPAG